MSQKLGERLVSAGLVTPDAVKQALLQQKITGRRLGDCLFELGLLRELDLLHFLAREFKTRFISTERLSKLTVPPDVLERVPSRLAQENTLLPLAYDVERSQLSVVMAEPQNATALNELSLVAEAREVIAYVGLRSAIDAAVRTHYLGDQTANALARRAPEPGTLRSDVATMAGAYESSPLRGRKTPPALLLESEGRARGPAASASPRMASALRDIARGLRLDVDVLALARQLVGTIEAHKPHGGYAAVLARKCRAVGRHLGMSPSDLGALSLAAMLQDVVAPKLPHVSLATLGVSSSARSLARQSCEEVSRFTRNTRLPPLTASLLMQRLEAFDGSGVPLGLKGEALTLGARVLGTLDAHLDLTRNPANHRGTLLSYPEAREHLGAATGRLYDPEVVSALDELQTGSWARSRLSTAGREVIVGDPEVTTRKELAAALLRRGVPALGAERGEALVEHLAEGSDLLAVSLGFGYADVLALIQYARSISDHAAVPIVVIGEPVDDTAKSRLLDSGATVILSSRASAVEQAEAIAELFRASHALGSPSRLVETSLDELSARALLAALGELRASGRLAFRAGGADGELFLEEGALVAGSFFGERGSDAAQALLALDNAEVSFDFEALLVTPPEERTPLGDLVAGAS